MEYLELKRSSLTAHSVAPPLPPPSVVSPYSFPQMWTSVASTAEVAASAASTLLAATNVPAQWARAGCIGTAKIAQVGSTLCWPELALHFGRVGTGALEMGSFHTEEAVR